MKKALSWGLVLWLVLLPVLGMAAEPSVTIENTATEMEFGQQDFLSLCGTAGFEMRADLALEGFVRGDFNGDGAEDVAVALFRNGEVNRTLLLLLSDGDGGSRAVECEYALPPTDFDLLYGEDTFKGLEIRDGMLVLHQERILDDQVHSWINYQFGPFGGELSLKQLDILRWNIFTSTAEYEHFDYEQGKWYAASGTYQSPTFQPAEPPNWQGFSSNAQSLALAGFDITQFPTDLEGYRMWWEDQGTNADITGTVEQEVKEAEKAAATKTPKPAEPKATAEPSVTCERCGKTMRESAYAKHDCTAKQVQCPNCKAWYAEGAEYNNHICEAKETPKPAVALLTCPTCGAVYDEASGHTCPQAQ